MGVLAGQSDSYNMLVFLSLISAAMAAPQLYPYYGTYGMYGYPGYGYPMVHSPMVNYPASYYPAQRLIPNYPTVGSPMAGTRNLIKFGNFLQQNGILDVFSGSEAKFSMYIMSSNDLTGKNIKVNLGTGASCLAASTGTLVELAMVNAPPSINGFYISGTTKGYNIDGMNSKTALMGSTNWLVLTESGTVIGCSKTALQ